MIGELGSNLAGTLGILGFALLAVYLLWSFANGIAGRTVVIASLTLLVWACARKFYPSAPATQLLELIGYAAWTAVLLRILDVHWRSFFRPAMRHQQVLLWLAVLLFAINLFGWWALSSALPLGKLSVCLFGLILVEQVIRNTRRDYHWHLRFFAIGLGWIYAYGVLIYSQAALFGRLSNSLYALQPLVFTLAAPLLAVASQRYGADRFGVGVSRRFVFRTTVILTAGLYLVLLIIVAAFARTLAAPIANVLDTTILLGGLITIPVMLGSQRIRGALRAFIGRNLYEYKYDYRDEWNRVSQQLLHPDPDDALSIRVIKTLSETIHAPGGALWRFNKQGLLVLEAHHRVRWSNQLQPELSNTLREFFAGSIRGGDFVLDLQSPDTLQKEQARSGVDLPLDRLLDQMPGARFIVPLQLSAQIYGLAILREPNLPIGIIWEDYEILRSIARQSAGVLALHRADNELQANLQLQAFETSSAFVVHDIKSVVAQLQLLLQNAEKHRNNPEFFEAMLATTTHATQKMDKLLSQLSQRQQPVPTEPQAIHVLSLVNRCLAGFSDARPCPSLSRHSLGSSAPALDDLWLHGDPDRLSAALSHLVQNAVDATPADGSVHVAISSQNDWLSISVNDTGSGMEQHFIDTRLFKPFESSTKGLTGMGIGVYQTRETTRAFGGELHISSSPGAGSSVVMQLPLRPPPDALAVTY